jgi:signal transduction histidine kinase
MNRFRLAGAYVAVMLVGLLLFAAAAVFAIDRTQRSTLDVRMSSAARVATTFLDVRHGSIEVDADDRRQFLTVLGTDTDGAVFDPQGRVVLSSSARVPAAIAPRMQATPVFFHLGGGDTAVRAYSFPIVQYGRRLGTVVVWRGIDWIDETDRTIAIALAAAALLIAGLALLAGNVVTQRALEDAFARQRRFTADASHELRAPLAVIRAEADLALRKERDGAAYRGALETIASEADRMESLIGDLLSAARAESGASARERIDAAQVLARVAERLASAATAKGAAVRVQSASNLTVLADEQALERALLAIGHNAVRFTPQGGSVNMLAQRLDNTVEIAIHDDGPGFSPEALEHALERFWREPAAPAGSGSGLGLAIARSIVESSRGSIAISNRAGGGAAVHLRFPAL